MMRLSERLRAIYDMVPSFEETADIGADHGKLIISLAKDGKISHGYAVENKKGPFDRLVEAINSNDANELVTPIFSDGIKDIPSSVKTVIIAGMGGNAIIDILKNDLSRVSSIDTLIVDPHGAIPQVRKEIVQFGFFIEKEILIQEMDQFYELIRFQRGEAPNYSDLEYEFGPTLIAKKSPLFVQKYSALYNDLNRVLKEATLPEFRTKEIVGTLARIDEVLK